MNRRNNSNGMTIVEVLVSVIIISLVMGVLFALLIQVQKASTDVKKKSSLLIAQNVVTKAIEKDMIEIGVKAISKCTFDQFGFNPDSIDSTENYECVRIEYNQSYDIADVGYILVYKQKNSSWVIRYGKGYYKDCKVGMSIESSNYGSWKDTYSVVQKLEDNVNLDIPPENNPDEISRIVINYTANYEMGKKYSEQKENRGNLFIPISDENGYNYNIDLSFSFRINDPAEPTSTNPKSIFVCDSGSGITCQCSGSESNCNKTNATVEAYQFVCSEEKQSVGSVIGINKNFTDLPSVIEAKLFKNKIATIKFEDAQDKSDITGIDVSYSQNGSAILKYESNPSDPNLFDVTIYQLGGVSVYGNSLSGMFKGFTNLKKVDFNNFKSTGITNLSSLFYECKSLVELANFDSFDLSLVRDVSFAFYKCTSLSYSPFRERGDLGNIRIANALFTDDTNIVGSKVGDEYIFDYEVEFPAFNVTTLNGAFKHTGIKKFKLGDKDNIRTISFPNLKNMGGMLAYNSKMVDSYINKLNLPNVITMESLFDNCDLLKTSNFTNIQSPNLENISTFYGMCDSLTDHGFSNFDTHNVTDFSRLFMQDVALVGKNGDGHIDLSMLSFDNALYMTSMFEQCKLMKTLKFSNKAGFNLDTVTNTVWMFGYAYAFEHFEGSTFTLHGVTTAGGMFTYTNREHLYTNVFDISFMEMYNCKNFAQMFQSSGYRAIDMSGIHTKVPYGTNIQFNHAFTNCEYLAYVFLQDFEVKGGIGLQGLFDGCSRLTFVDGSFTTDEEINNYLTGNTVNGKDYSKLVTKNGRSPFDNMITSSGGSWDMQWMFRNCSLLRGFPDGYLDGILRDYNWTRYVGMFQGAFNNPISREIVIDQAKYKELYQLVLPLGLSAYFQTDDNTFDGCRNLASITFKNGRGVYLYHSVDVTNIFHNVGRYAFEQDRIDKFVLNIGDFLLYPNTVGYNDDGFAQGLMYTFRQFNMNEYNGKMEIVLSTNCYFAKKQYAAFTSTKYDTLSNYFGELTFTGPSGCSLT